VALVREIFLALAILAIVSARAEEVFQTVMHEFLEIPAVGRAHEVHEGLQDDFVRHNAREGTFASDGDTAPASFLAVFRPIDLGLVQLRMEVVIEVSQQADARKFLRVRLVLGIETVIVCTTVVTVIGAGNAEKIAEGFERVAVLGSIRVIVSLGKPVGIGSLTDFVLQFRNAE
jgi:hypothetical protein